MILILELKPTMLVRVNGAKHQAVFRKRTLERRRRSHGMKCPLDARKSEIRIGNQDVKRPTLV